MKKQILITAAMAAVMLLTSCSSEGNSDVLPETSVTDTSTFEYESDISEGNSDALPEIPVTEESAFEYKYNSELGGMEITDYLKESPKVRIPDTLEGEPVKSVDLSKCEKELTQLVMPDSVVRFYLSNKTTVSLQYLGVPNDATDYNVAIQHRPSLFRNMTESEFYDNAISDAHREFGTFKSLISIGVSANNPCYCSLDGILCSKMKNELMLLVCPRGKSGEITIPSSVTTIGKYAFYNCNNLTSVSIPDNVTKIGKSAFTYCEDIKVEYRGKNYTYDNIDELYDAINLSECDMLIENNTLERVSKALTEAVIPDSVTDISKYAFKGCTNLTSVSIPDSVTYIDEGTFDECTSINITYNGKVYTYSQIDKLYGAIRRGLTIEDGVLTKVSNDLTKVVIPDRVTEISYKAFDGCDNVTSITFGKCITILSGTDSVLNGRICFWCTNLTEVTIPYSVTKLGDLAFMNCKKLKTVNLPDGLRTIGDSAFRNCNSLTSITIPDSLIWIGSDVFEDCENIKVTYKGKTYDYNHIDDLYQAINGY